MFFTIIIPTYNNLSLLKLALSSCQRQRFSDFEVIITDDSTNEVIEEYVSHLHLPWLKYHRNQSSLGAVNNWNHGLTLAKGDHIMVLHHDESMASDDFLTRVSAAFLPQVDVVVSNVSVDGRRQKWWLHHVLSPLLLHFPTTLFACNFIGPTACLCFKKEQMQLFNPSLCWAVDYEWYYRMLQNSHVRYLRTNYIRSHHGHKGQIIALNEQHYRACEFGVKTVVLLVRSQCVRQTELVECGLNSLVRQQYGCELLREWCRQFPLKLVLQDRNKRVVLGKVQTVIQNLTCYALCFEVRKTLRHGIAVSS